MFHIQQRIILAQLRASKANCNQNMAFQLRTRCSQIVSCLLILLLLVCQALLTFRSRRQTLLFRPLWAHLRESTKSSQLWAKPQIKRVQLFHQVTPKTMSIHQLKASQFIMVILITRRKDMVATLTSLIAQIPVKIWASLANSLKRWAKSIHTHMKQIQKTYDSQECVRSHCQLLPAQFLNVISDDQILLLQLDSIIRPLWNLVKSAQVYAWDLLMRT